MSKLQLANWISQIMFPVQAYEGVGNARLYYRERTIASLRAGSVIAGAVVNLWTEVVRWQSARRTEAALRACSDRTLRDVGIDRSEITSIAYFGGRDRRRGGADRD